MPDKLHSAANEKPAGPERLEEQSKSLDVDKRIQKWVRPCAGSARVLIQMAIGILLVAYVLHLAWDFVLFRDIDNHMKYGNLLGIIGYGLVVSAGVDLAYMLFTPKLDEAVEPLIVALSAGAIILLSKEGVEPVWGTPVAVLLMVASIVALFWVKKNFLGED
jgi:hypothetical protein